MNTTKSPEPSPGTASSTPTTTSRKTWCGNLVGEAQIESRDAVIAACETASNENAEVTTSWLGS